MKRIRTIPVKVGNLIIGGGNPIVVQTMTKTLTTNIEDTVQQIKQIEQVGGKLVRLAVPDSASADAIKVIKSKVKIPLVADVHFNYKLAIQCIKNGIDKVRINPANIGSLDRVVEIIKAAKDYDVAVRIGLNAGSYKRRVKNIKSLIIAQAEKFVDIFEKYRFKKLVISAKTADVSSTVEIYQTLAKRYKYPLHLGITEAGPLLEGSIKSALGIGILLWNGIGDTIRVSLSSSPVDEVKVGYTILQSLGLARYGVDLISCPTCGRCKVDLLSIITKFQEELRRKKLEYKNLKVAIMGCEVNGPGEASSADVGIALGKNSGVLFVKGKILKKVSIEDCVDELIEQMYKL
ncbi:MAG: flavodoxin-dependent (E)-4-hydroxy-3-methylbut-2-enyl-diphosphate synthase [Endomicrobia bacterium]|nr:flavodoxin-dependent (E)-4-hydroxy-3-methylbut-2-enyl-diphosphate synthase [Endomicrobiia bacterium]MDW8055278.1 flavodoxin-dependent (E)-4-hydroxy-3-methylbut-2-enyl-diphosphate synthase [Elusimicrobiota bacterium]